MATADEASAHLQDGALGERMLVVGIEGPCCAGKSTLSDGLIRSPELMGQAPVRVRDYSDHVGGGRFLPPPVPDSLSEEEEALRTFLRIERERCVVAGADSDRASLVLIDRSVHTLIAHCAALQRLTGEPHRHVAERVFAMSQIPLWPQLILNLDVSVSTMHSRNNGKFAVGSIYMDPQFNAGIREYFAERRAAVGSPEVVDIDGSQPIEEVRCQALGIISQRLVPNSGRKLGA